MNGTQLREIRLKKGLSQAQLARILHVTPTTVYRWEAGVRHISDLAAIAITGLRHHSTKKPATRHPKTS